MILVKNILKGVLMGGLSPRRLYRLLIAFTLLIPVIYGAYILVTMARQDLSFNALLTTHPLYSTMFLVVLLDVIWGYLLSVVSDSLTDHEGQVYNFDLLILMTLSQLLVGNIVIAILTGYILINMNASWREAMTLKTLRQHGLYSSMAVGLVLVSVLCCYVFVRLTFFI